MVLSKVVYGNKPMQVFGGGFFLFCTLGFIIQIFTPGKGGVGLQVFAGITAVTAAWLTARCFVAPTITADLNGVRIRTLVRTRKYSWPEVERFRVEVRMVRQYRRKVLGVELRNGQTAWFSELNGSPKRVGWVDEAVDALNSYGPEQAGRALDPHLE